MREWLQVVAVLLATVAAVLRRTERRVVSALRSAGASSEANAIELPTFSRLGRWQLGRLIKSGAVVSASDHRYYFDPSGYAAFRTARRRRVMVAVPLLLVTLLFLRYLSP